MRVGLTILNRKALKAEYLGCFAARARGAQALLVVIKDLLGLGVVRATLFRWGVAAGYSQATVRSLLSRAFCRLGLRERKTGAGRKPSAEGLELLAHARRQYGGRALRVLRAAHRAGQAQATAQAEAAVRIKIVPGVIAVPQLAASGRRVRVPIAVRGPARQWREVWRDPEPVWRTGRNGSQTNQPTVRYPQDESAGL